MSWNYYRPYGPYVSAAEKRAKAQRALARLRKQGDAVGAPVKPDGRTIAHSFWGQAWCRHLEKFSDFENRLPRGRSYLRNGAVLSLELVKDRVQAKVAGSRLYEVEVQITPLPKPGWKNLKEQCAGQVGSALELLQGRLSAAVMERVTDRDQGLFPKPKEMRFDCSCPDWAGMCKHVAAVLYGVGMRLDQAPELLFRLRGVDHHELIGETTAQTVVARGAQNGKRLLAESELAAVFGIETGAPVAQPRSSGRERKGIARRGRKPLPVGAADSGPPKRGSKVMLTRHRRK